MINAVNVPTQVVGHSQNVLFANTRVCTNSCAMRHESGSGVVTLICPGVYEIEFSGTVSMPNAGNVILNITAEGDAVAGAQANITVGANGANSFVCVPTLIRVYREGNVRIAVRNDTTTPVNITNANLIVKRLS